MVGGSANSKMTGLRQAAAGPRVLARERLLPGHWYRLRLQIAAAATAGRLWLQDLTAGQTEPWPRTFAAGAEATLTPAPAWTPAWPQLDTLVLRLGSGAQARRLTLSSE